MALLRVGPLPQEALAAAARFHADILPRAVAALADAGELVLVFPPADHTHRGWRLAAVQGLAREHAPIRVNALASDDEAAIAAAADYLASAPGITGQLLPLDGNGACDILSLRR
jgi:hypothetical protein